MQASTEKNASFFVAEILLKQKAILFVLIIAAFLRLYGTFDHQGYFPLSDEGVHIPNALSLMQFGTTTEFNWQHPQFGSLILQATIKIFGNNSVGWRISNVIFGTASVLLIWLIGKKISAYSSTPLLAAAFLAFDPFHILNSRTTFTEIPVTLFFMLFFYFLLDYPAKKYGVLIPAGIFMGLTIATKAYYTVAIPIVILYAFFNAQKNGESPRNILIDFFATLLLIPLSLYLLSWFQWFGRGYTLHEFWQMQLDSVWLQNTFKLSEFLNPELLKAGGHPWEWFIKPIITGGMEPTASGGVKRYLLEINNFPIRLFTLPAMALLLLEITRKRSTNNHLILLPLVFTACYSLLLFVDRPIFNYSALVLLPFAYLAIAEFISAIGLRLKCHVFLTMFILAMTLLWGLYTFPLVTGKPVAVSFYKPLLSLATFIAGESQ